MASFRTHISFGLALGAMAPLLLAGTFLAPDGWDQFLLVGVAIAVGSVAPDIDSDSGIPFHITFATLSLVAGALSLRYALGVAPGDWLRLVGYPLTAMFVVWAIIGSVFKKFTCHRGMAHSVPAAALAGLVVFVVTANAGFTDSHAALLGAGMSAGYLLHLALDEAHAAVNFHNKPFIPNKAFGSALKFFSNSALVNMGVYGAIIYLTAVNTPRFVALIA
jgi:hypothetical protein